MPDNLMTEATLDANRSSSLGSLAAALAEAQKNFTPIPKDREVTVKTDKGSYKFKYATLDAIRSATMPALAEQKIAVVQGMIEHNNGYAVETKLLHASGEWLRNVTPMFVSGRRSPDGRSYPPTNQELGSAQSYARRYGLSALLCITADEDDDGNTADGNHIEGSSERTPYRPRDAAPPPARGSSANGRRMAAEEPDLVDHNRTKGTMPGKPAAKTDDKAARLDAARKNAKEWAVDQVVKMNESEMSIAELRGLEEANREKLDWMQGETPESFDKFYVAFNNAIERAMLRGDREEEAA